MSLPLKSRRHRSLFGLLFAVGSCGGEVSDDATASIGTGGTSKSTSTGGYSAKVSFVVLGGANTGGFWNYSSSSLVSSQTTAYGGSMPRASGGYGPGGVYGGGAKPIGGTVAAGGIYGGGGRSSSSSGGRSQVTSGSLTGGLSAIGGEVCLLPANSGDCDAYMLKYFFNPSHGQCEQFFYGGCGGNQNRFDTLADCQNRCDVKSPLCPSDIPPTDEIVQCNLSSICYYQVTSGCGCIPQFRSAPLISECNSIDLGCQGLDSDASTPMPDAGIGEGWPVEICTCGSPAWTCRTWYLTD
jgi:hypothetical protein